MQGLQWFADHFNSANGPYVMPLEQQFYIGFYNKSLSPRRASSPCPPTGSQLYADCSKLKKAGFTPMVYGNGGQALGAEFYPWYDASYMMIGAYSVSQWKGLYSGAIPWTGPAVKAQVGKWAGLHAKGCTNNDVLTDTTNLRQFNRQGGHDGRRHLGHAEVHQTRWARRSAAFVPPFSDSPIKGVVQYPGDGLRSPSTRSTSPRGGVPGVPGDAAGQRDHQQGRSDPGCHGHQDQQPGEPADAGLRQAGLQTRTRCWTTSSRATSSTPEQSVPSPCWAGNVRGLGAQSR